MEKLIKQTLILSGPILIGLGIFKFTLFYFFFNIPITKFLELSEVIVLFANDILTYIVASGLGVLLSFWTYNTHQNYKFKRKTITYFRQEDISHRILIYLRNYPVTLVTFFLLLASVYFTGKYRSYLYVAGFAFIVILFLTTTLNIIILETKRKIWLVTRLSKRFENHETLLKFFISLVNIVAVYTCLEVQRVKYEHKYINTSFKVDNTVFKSDSNHFFIGKTNRYVFVYDLEKDNSTVYPIERVSEFDFGPIIYLPVKKDETK